MVGSPDLGSVTRARNFAARLDCPRAIVDKRRQQANVCEVMNIIGSVEGKKVILVDDMIDTAGTLCNAAAAIVEKGGAKSVIAAATHAVLSGPAIERLRKSVIDNVVLLDTIALPPEKRLDKFTLLPVDVYKRQISRLPAGYRCNRISVGWYSCPPIKSGKSPTTSSCASMRRPSTLSWRS